MSDATFLIALAVAVFLFHMNPVAAIFAIGALYVVGKLVFSGPD